MKKKENNWNWTRVNKNYSFMHNTHILYDCERGFYLDFHVLFFFLCGAWLLRTIVVCLFRISTIKFLFKNIFCLLIYIRVQTNAEYWFGFCQAVCRAENNWILVILTCILITTFCFVLFHCAVFWFCFFFKRQFLRSKIQILTIKNFL